MRQRGSEDIAGNINGPLDTLNQNAEFIAKGIAELTVSPVSRLGAISDSTPWDTPVLRAC
jgi:hypothetical protein